MSPADAFEPFAFRTERAGIRYAIGGSWASALQEGAVKLGIRDLLEKALKEA